MYDAAYPFPILTSVAGTNGQYDGLLGTLVIHPTGKAYRLCKNGAAAITTAQGRFVSSAVSSKATNNQPTWVMSLPAASSTYKQYYRAQIPYGTTGSGSTSTTLAASDYFWAQVSGPTKFVCGTAVVAVAASNCLVVLSTGWVKQSTLTTAIALKASVGFGTHTATTTAANAVIGGMLVGLM